LLQSNSLAQSGYIQEGICFKIGFSSILIGFLRGKLNDLWVYKEVSSKDFLMAYYFLKYSRMWHLTLSWLAEILQE